MTNQELLQKLRLCGHYLHRMPDGRMSQRRILGILGEKDEMTQRELQGMLDIRSASMSEILGKIEGEGLIERRPSPEDRRAVQVRLSEEGRTVAAALRQAYDRQTEELFSCLNEAEKQALGDYLDRLQAHWQEKFSLGEGAPRGPHGFGPGPHRPGPGGPHRPGPGGPRGPRPHGFDQGEEGPRGREFDHGFDRGEGPDAEGHGPEGWRHGGPRGFHGGEGRPGPRGERPERVLPGRFGGEERPSYRVLPGAAEGEDGLTTLPGGDVCNHDCANCRLREEGRCVRRVQRRL